MLGICCTRNFIHSRFFRLIRYNVSLGLNMHHENFDSLQVNSTRLHTIDPTIDRTTKIAPRIDIRTSKPRLLHTNPLIRGSATSTITKCDKPLLLSTSVHSNTVPSPLLFATSIFPTTNQNRSFSSSRSLLSRRDTYNPSRRVQKRRHGFLARIRTRSGRAIIHRRRAKGRRWLSW